MKKMFVSLTILVAMSLLCVDAQAGPAKHLKNLGRGVLRTVATPFKCVRDVSSDVVEGVVKVRPILAVSNAIRDSRENTLDLGESAVRAVTTVKPIPLEENGSVNKEISKAGPVAEIVADSAFVGAVTGALVHSGRVGVSHARRVTKSVVASTAATASVEAVDLEIAE